MKVKDYSYETFPRYTKDIEGALELKGNKENLRCRMHDVSRSLSYSFSFSKYDFR